jgi:hypothetical protein
MIPRWLVDKRLQICAQCERTTECEVRFQLLQDAPECPLKLLANRDDEVTARAWPAGAESVSGCCDSALNYLS